MPSRKAKRGARNGGGRDERNAVAPAAESDGEEEEEEEAAGATAAAVASAGGTAGLPMANLVRLMRRVIPRSVKISSRAKQLTHDCAVEFVGFVAGEASERAAAQHRRTIAPEDFTRGSFRTLGLDGYVDPMSTYIRRYRESHTLNHGGGGGGIIAPRTPPAAPAPTPTPAVAAPAAPCFSDEEMRFLSTVVPPHHGKYDYGAGSSSVNAPTTPAGNGYGYYYTGYR